MSNILRTVAFTADTSTAAMMSQERRFPIQVLTVSTSRLNGRSDLRIAFTNSLYPGAAFKAGHPLHPPRATAGAVPHTVAANLKGCAAVN
jgi:hypothetical protein